jgi:hypothetical protein
MFKIQPVRWFSRYAASGLGNLPRMGGWLLSKALSAPGAVTAASGDGVASGLRRVVAAATGVALPGAYEPVEARLKRAEVAVARATKAEQDALAEAQIANALAAKAKSVSDEGRERLRQASRDGRQEVDRRTQLAKEHSAHVIEHERDKASQEAAATLEHLTADVAAKVDKARAEAEDAAELALGLINSAHQQTATARALAADAATAAEKVAVEAHQRARAVTYDAPDGAEAAATRAVQAEQRQDVPADLTEHTKAELLDLARSLDVAGASRMTKTQLVKAIRTAS